MLLLYPRDQYAVVYAKQDFPLPRSSTLQFKPFDSYVKRTTLFTLGLIASLVHGASHFGSKTKLSFSCSKQRLDATSGTHSSTRLKPDNQALVYVLHCFHPNV